MATKHFVLEHGDILQVIDGQPQDTWPVVDGVEGCIVGILDNDNDDKTCFIFSNGDDILRFYLDRGMRPASRLLILLCSRLSLLKTGIINIRSVKVVDRIGCSRLHMEFVDSNGEILDNGEAPYHLPSDYAAANGMRIRLILSALELVEDDRQEESSPANDNGTVITSTAGELGEHAPVVVAGLENSAAVAPVNSRTVTLVRGYPVIAVVYDTISFAPVCGESALDTYRKIMSNANVQEFVSKNFVTKKEADAFIEGLETAITGLDQRFIYFNRTKEDIISILQERASSM